jgi:hypothetical protein
MTTTKQKTPTYLQQQRALPAFKRQLHKCMAAALKNGVALSDFHEAINDVWLDAVVEISKETTINMIATSTPRQC